MSDALWTSNGFNIADTQHTQDAITAIRTVTSSNKLSQRRPSQQQLATVVQDVTTYCRYYQESVLAVDDIRIHPAEMYQEFVREVVIQDIGNSTNWIERRMASCNRFGYHLRNRNRRPKGSRLWWFESYRLIFEINLITYIAIGSHVRYNRYQ
jgi:hypothetical protein